MCFVCFGSIPKQRVSVFRLNRKKQKQPKQCDRERILEFFSSNLRLFWFFKVCFGLFQNSLFRLFCFYTQTESIDVLIEPKQTEDQPKHFDREHILVLFRKCRVVSVCFGLFRNSSVCFSCFNIGSKHQNFLFLVSWNKPQQILFRFVTVRTKYFFSLFWGHPSPASHRYS